MCDSISAAVLGLSVGAYIYVYNVQCVLTGVPTLDASLRKNS